MVGSSNFTLLIVIQFHGATVCSSVCLCPPLSFTLRSVPIPPWPAEFHLRSLYWLLNLPSYRTLFLSHPSLYNFRQPT